MEKLDFIKHKMDWTDRKLITDVIHLIKNTRNFAKAASIARKQRAGAIAARKQINISFQKFVVQLRCPNCGC